MYVLVAYATRRGPTTMIAEVSPAACARTACTPAQNPSPT